MKTLSQGTILVSQQKPDGELYQGDVQLEWDPFNGFTNITGQTKALEDLKLTSDYLTFFK